MLQSKRLHIGTYFIKRARQISICFRISQFGQIDFQVRYCGQIMTFVTIAPFRALISAVFLLLLYEMKILILFVFSLQVDHYLILYLVSLTVVIRMAFEGHHPGPLQQRRRQPLVSPLTCPYFIGLIHRLLLVLIASMVCTSNRIW